MKILFATQNLPYPTDAGDRLRTRNLIELLSGNYKLHCLFFPKGRRDLRDVPSFKRTFPPDIPYSLIVPEEKPLPFMRGYQYVTDPVFKRQRVISNLIQQLTSFKPDAVWLDYLFIGQYISPIKELQIPVIYGTHNSQSDLTRQLAEAQPVSLKKYVFHLMAYLHRWHERKFFNLADRLVCVSEQDRLFHQGFVSPEKIAVIPNFINLKNYDDVKPESRPIPYICFVGSLDNHQNEQGVKFFLREIWSLVSAQAENIRLLIIGRGAKGDHELMSMASKFDNIDIMENVPSVIPYIKGATVSIVPLLQGSGTRLKIIESMACHRAIVSTSIGAEGLGAEDGKEIFIADTPEVFTDRLLCLLQNTTLRKGMGDRAYKFVKSRFDVEAVEKTIKQLITATT